MFNFGYKLGIFAICMQLSICLGGDVSFAAPHDHAAPGMAGGAAGSGAGISLEESQAQTREQDSGYDVGEQKNFLVEHDGALKSDDDAWEATAKQAGDGAEEQTDYDLEIQRNQEALANRRAEEAEKRRQRREQQERELAEMRASFAAFENDHAIILGERNEELPENFNEMVTPEVSSIAFTENGPEMNGPLVTLDELPGVPVVSKQRRSIDRNGEESPQERDYYGMWGSERTWISEPGNDLDPENPWDNEVVMKMWQT